MISDPSSATGAGAGVRHYSTAEGMCLATSCPPTPTSSTSSSGSTRRDRSMRGPRRAAAASRIQCRCHYRSAADAPCRPTSPTVPVAPLERLKRRGPSFGDTDSPPVSSLKTSSKAWRLHPTRAILIVLLVTATLLCPVRFRAVLPTVVVHVSAAAEPQRLEWCEYMERVGIDVPECRTSTEEEEEERGEGELEELEARMRGRPVDRGKLTGNGGGRETTASDEEPDSYESLSMFEQCRGYYGRCRPSFECESGTVCSHKPNGHSCCTSPKVGNQCPSVDELGYLCKKRDPINWCASDGDCGSNLVRSQLCCPTGCGYNVCLNNVEHTPASVKFVEMQAMAKKLSRDCPNPFLIPVNCLVPRPVSWCESVRDCPTYEKQHPRRCCLTPCGYNICLTRFEDRWMIL